VIRVRGLCCGYPGRQVLRSLSFGVAPGEFVGILGPNGSGKTTLLLTLSGLIAPRAGNVEIFGFPLARLERRQRARHLAAVAQEGEVRFPFACEEVVWMGRYPHQKRWQLATPRDAAAVARALELTDTFSLASRLITAVSGGEKQRVLIARALAQETALLLLDEPTSAMDIHRKLQVFRVLEALNREQGVTILAVLHDINLAALFCRRLLFLKNGTTVADGPPRETLTAGVLEEVYETPAVVLDVAERGLKQVMFLP
jgi:iron complex transport system ATP-binding protein